MLDKILLIDKPKGFTSHDIVNLVRKKYKTKKVGHAGTLDPNATGLLIILVGKSTKKSSQFLNLDKTYKAEIAFGIETDTYDSQGKIKSYRGEKILKDLTYQKLKNTLRDFTGEINQAVPPFSAVKVKGKKLYQLARKGKKITPPTKVVKIHEIKVDQFKKYKNKELPIAWLTIKCSKGTYIRSLAFDLGRKLKTGAYLKNLRRTRIGELDIKNAARLT